MTLTSNSLIKTTNAVEIASAQPRLLLDRGDGSYSWSIYNGGGTDFPLSSFNIANNANTAIITALDGGNVGIGTTSPDRQLEISTTTAGLLTSSANRQGSVIKLTHNINHEAGYTGGDFLGGIEFESGDGSAGAGVRAAIRAEATNPYNTHSLKFYTATSNSTSIASRMTIDHNGNVGIGTDNPDSPLEISGADDTRLKLTDTGDSSELMLRSDGANTQIYTNTAHDLGIYTSGNLGQLHLKQSNGNVGIGTTNPPYKLVVSNNGASGIEFGPAYSGTTNLVQHYNRATSSYVDVNTSALQHKFYNGATFAAIIDSSGNVGIGTTAPAKKLHISSGVNDTPTTLRIENTDTSIETNQEVNTIEFYSNDASASGTGVSGKIAQYAVNPGNQYGLAFSTYNVSDSGLEERMRIQHNGNVGIGTTSPLTNLHIGSGTEGENLGLKINRGATTNFLVACDGTKQAYIGTDNSQGYIKLGSLSNHPVQISQNNANAIYIDTSKNVGIGTTAPTRGLTIDKSGALAALNIIKNNTGNQIAYLGTGGSGATDNGIMQLYHSGTELVRLYTTGASFFNGGNVGIGTTTPDTSLHVVKNQSSAASSIKLENAAGGNNSSFDIDWQLASSGTSAQIKAIRTNTPGAGDTDLRFSTSTTGTTLVEAMRIRSDSTIQTVNGGFSTSTQFAAVIEDGSFHNRRSQYYGGNMTHGGQTYKFVEGNVLQDALKIYWNNSSWGGVSLRIKGMGAYTANQNFDVAIGLQGHAANTSASYDATNNATGNWASYIDISQPATGVTLIKMKGNSTSIDVVFMFEWVTANRSNQQIRIEEQ